jgi:hypothetical protein
MPDLVKIAFDDPSWRSNPRMPLMSELAELFWSAYQGTRPGKMARCSKRQKQSGRWKVVRMTTMIAVWLKLMKKRVVSSACKRPVRTWMRQSSGDVTLWIFFRAAGSIRARSQGDGSSWPVADDKGVKVVLRGVNVDVYKVLKLVGRHRFPPS